LRTKTGFDAGLQLSFASDQEWVEPQFDPDAPGGFDRTPLPIEGSAVLVGRIAQRLFDDQIEFGIAGTNLLDIGSSRSREHPFANRREARVVAELIGRF
jgi:hypothetical protein